MARSPIEIMVDEACGFDPHAPKPAARIPEVSREAQILMNVGDAAVAWLRQRKEGTEASLRDAERLLVLCAKELAATGW